MKLSSELAIFNVIHRNCDKLRQFCEFSGNVPGKFWEVFVLSSIELTLRVKYNLSSKENWRVLKIEKIRA